MSQETESERLARTQRVVGVGVIASQETLIEPETPGEKTKGVCGVAGKVNTVEEADTGEQP